MALTYTYYLADFMTGDLLEPLPKGSVTVDKLSSSLRPGSFDLTVNLEAAFGSMSESRAWVSELERGRFTLVPIQEGVTNGPGNITSREAGEWWIPAVNWTFKGNTVQLQGPEWDGYAQSVHVADQIKGNLDPVVTLRTLLGLLYSTSQTVAVDLQSWVSHTGARVDVDISPVKTTYWSEIEKLTAAEGGPFEWMTRTGLVLDGWVPQRVTRTLEVGQPRLALTRSDVTLEVTAPGLPRASLEDATGGSDKRDYPSTIYGWGSGTGKDQRHAFKSRNRIPGEPAVNAVVTARDARTTDEVARYVGKAMDRLNPYATTFQARMPVAEYTPRKGEVYGFYADAGWARGAVAMDVQCAGWSWDHREPEWYTLDLVEV